MRPSPVLTGRVLFYLEKEAKHVMLGHLWIIIPHWSQWGIIIITVSTTRPAGLPEPSAAEEGLLAIGNSDVEQAVRDHRRSAEDGFLHHYSNWFPSSHRRTNRFIDLFIEGLYSPVNRTWSPQGFSQVQMSHKLNTIQNMHST